MDLVRQPAEAGAPVVRFIAGFAMTAAALPVAIIVERLDIGLHKWLDLIDRVDPARAVSKETQ